MSTFSFFLKVESPRFFPVTARVNMRVPYKVLFYGQLLHEPDSDSFQYVICKLGVFFTFM